MKNKYPDTLDDLIDVILEEIPQALEKREELFALIKTYIHGEKFCLWSELDPYVETHSYASKRIIKPKMETHGRGKDGWYDFEKNLKWVREHSPGPPNTERFMRETDEKKCKK